MTDSLVTRCGQLIGAGFDGLEVPGTLRRRIAEGRVGFVILFGRNVTDPSQVARLCADLQAQAPPGAPLAIAVDQEGGRVRRLREPWPSWPPAASLGASGDPGLVLEAGVAIGEELASCGIHLNLAPVLDVHTNPANPVIGDRAFATTPEAVAVMAGAFARGLHRAGVASVGKHFPGHGDTHLDSHTHLPVVSHGAARLREVELAPFAALAHLLPAMMSAHVVFEALDPEWPATLSRAVIQGLLRQEMGFEGLVLSDDLEMRAVADRYPPEELAVTALEAGVDVLCTCHHRARQERMLAALVRRATHDARFSLQVKAAADRVAAFKARWVAGRPAPDPQMALTVATRPRHHALAEALAPK